MKFLIVLISIGSMEIIKEETFLYGLDANFWNLNESFNFNLL
jgi:hypothetical protein